MRRIRSRSKEPKRVIFTQPLLRKILAGAATVTYRKTRMNGYYYISTNRFRKKEVDTPIIQVYRTEPVEPGGLTDEDAKLAGVESAAELCSLLTKWYGEPTPRLYRNWFRLLRTLG